MKKLFSTRYTENGISFSLLLLRLAVAGLMLPHGFDKLIHFINVAKDFPDPLNVGKTISLSLVIFAEFFCSALLLVGLMTRLVTIPLIITMGVAFFMVHNHNFTDGTSQLSALFLAGYLVLLIAGPGKVSIDKMLGN